MINIVTINSRCAQVLLWLLSSNKPITINDFSRKFKVSNRTVRYDLDIVDEFLSDNGFKPLIRKPNSGIMLVGSTNEKQGLTKLMKNFQKRKE